MDPNLLAELHGNDWQELSALAKKNTLSPDQTTRFLDLYRAASKDLSRIMTVAPDSLEAARLSAIGPSLPEPSVGRAQRRPGRTVTVLRHQPAAVAVPTPLGLHHRGAVVSRRRRALRHLGGHTSGGARDLRRSGVPTPVRRARLRRLLQGEPERILRRGSVDEQRLDRRPIRAAGHHRRLRRRRTVLQCRQRRILRGDDVRVRSGLGLLPLHPAARHPRRSAASSSPPRRD
jgi:hypothetical protein